MSKVSPLAPVYAFLDNSNIYISAQKVAEQREPGFSNLKALRISFENLMDLVRSGRRLAYGYAVGSVPPELDVVWKKLKKVGFAVELLERGEQSGKEQGCDQSLQVQMLRVLSDYPPGVAVLLTGDGSGYADGIGFHADLERLQKKGWGIEVYSWNLTCNKKLRDWADQVGVYVPLEEYYENVTFIQSGRTASPIKKRKHAIAKPNTP